MTFTESIKTCFGKYADFSGRAQLSEFWWFSLPYIVSQVILPIVLQAVSMMVLLLGLPLLLPWLAVAVRRLHDTGRSAWWLLLLLVPILGLITLLVFCVLPGTVGPNRYDSEPADAPLSGRSKSMRIAGLVVGVVGAIWAFFGFVVFVMFIAMDSAFDDTRIHDTFFWALLGGSIVGLVGAVLSVVKPRMAASLMLVWAVMLVSAVIFVVSATRQESFLATLTIPLAIGATLTFPLVIGAALAFLGRSQNQNR